MTDALKNPVLLLKTGLVVGLLAVVGMAFRVSWNALKDIALAIGADDTAATLYAFVIDGLMVVALVASLYLDKRPRTFALCVLGGYTLASLVLNYVHGLVPELHEPTGEMTRLAEDGRVHNALVLLATSLPVGSIFFGSHLVATVLHHRPDPAPAVDETRNETRNENAPARDPLRELAEVRVARHTGAGYPVPEARTRSDVDAGTHHPTPSPETAATGTPEADVPVDEPTPVPAEVRVPEVYPTNGYTRPAALAETEPADVEDALDEPAVNGAPSATVDRGEPVRGAEPTEAHEPPQSASVAPDIGRTNV
jgi:hypothetical protein